MVEKVECRAGEVGNVGNVNGKVHLYSKGNVIVTEWQNVFPSQETAEGPAGVGAPRPNFWQLRPPETINLQLSTDVIGVIGASGAGKNRSLRNKLTLVNPTINAELPPPNTAMDPIGLAPTTINCTFRLPYLVVYRKVLLPLMRS